MNKRLVYWLGAALALTACGESASRPSSRPTSSRPTASRPTSTASSVNSGRPAGTLVVVDSDKAVPLSELTRGEVIRSGQVESAPLNSVPPASSSAPNNNYNNNYSAPSGVSGTGNTRGVVFENYDFNGNEIFGEPAIDYRQVAEQEVFADQSLRTDKPIFAEQICATSANGCEIPEVKNAEQKSGALKTLLKSVPLMRAEKNQNISAEESFEEQKLFSGAPGNYNEMKLPTQSPKSSAQFGQAESNRAVNSKLWPGGVPLSAEIDAAVMK